MVTAGHHSMQGTIYSDGKSSVLSPVNASAYQGDTNTIQRTQQLLSASQKQQAAPENGPPPTNKNDI